MKRRRYCEPHSHEVVLPSGRVIKTRQDCHRDIERELSNFPAEILEEELGFLPGLISAAAPIVGGLLGGMGGGAPPPTPAGPTILGGAPTDLSPVLSALGQQITTADVRGIVRELLSEVPSPVIEQVRQALSEYKANNADAQKTMSTIVNDIGKNLSPALNSAVSFLEQAQKQRLATNEHNVIVKSDKRWKANTNNQKLILKRLDALESRMAGEIRGRRGNTIRTAAAFGVPSKYV